MRIDDRARCGHQSGCRMRRERWADVLGTAALSADPRQEEDGARHLCAQLCEKFRPRRACHSADIGEARSSDTLGTKVVDETCEADAQRVIGRLVLDLGCAWIRGPDE